MERGDRGDWKGEGATARREQSLSLLERATLAERSPIYCPLSVPSRASATHDLLQLRTVHPLEMGECAQFCDEVDMVGR